MRQTRLAGPPRRCPGAPPGAQSTPQPHAAAPRSARSGLPGVLQGQAAQPQSRRALARVQAAPSTLAEREAAPPQAEDASAPPPLSQQDPGGGLEPSLFSNAGGKANFWLSRGRQQSCSATLQSVTQWPVPVAGSAPDRQQQPDAGPSSNSYEPQQEETRPGFRPRSSIRQSTGTARQATPVEGEPPCKVGEVVVATVVWTGERGMRATLDVDSSIKGCAVHFLPQHPSVLSIACLPQ